jgi:hypothetical protein
MMTATPADGKPPQDISGLLGGATLSALLIVGTGVVLAAILNAPKSTSDASIGTLIVLLRSSSSRCPRSSYSDSACVGAR